MHKQDRLASGAASAGGNRQATGRHNPRTIRIVALFVLVLGMVSQSPAHAQNNLEYGIYTDYARTDYCPKDIETYHMHVIIYGSRGPHDPMENSYVQINPDVVMGTEISPPDIGSIISSTIVQKYSPTPNLAIGDTVDFTFQAGKEGKGKITFKASVDGVQAEDSTVGIAVHPCTYEVSGESNWNYPYPAGVYTLTMKLMDTRLKPDKAKNSLSGQGSAVWVPDVTGPVCAFPYVIPASKVTIKGTLDDDGTLTQLTLTYGSVVQTDPVNCPFAGGLRKHTMSFSVISLKQPLLEQPIKKDHLLTSPMTVKGSATLFVHRVETDDGN